MFPARSRHGLHLQTLRQFSSRQYINLRPDSWTHRSWPTRLGMMHYLLLIVLVTVGCDRRPTEPIKSSHSRGDNAAQNSADDLAKARDLIAQGRFEEARSRLESRLSSFPDDVEAMLLLSDVELQQQRFERALEVANSVSVASSSKEQKLKQLYLSIAQGNAKQLQFQAAIQCLQQAVDRFPGDDELRRGLAQLLNVRGFRFQANEQIRELCRRAGATPMELQGLISPVRSYTGFNEKPDINDPGLIAKLGPLNVARGLYSEGDMKESLALLRDCALVKDKNPAAVAFYGRVLIEFQQFDEFKRWLNEVDSSVERFLAYWIALGNWAMHQRDFAAAVRCFGEAIVREPGDESANKKIAAALSAIDEDDQAARFTDRVKQINQATQIVKHVHNPSPQAVQAIRELPGVLAALDRQWESLAWYQLALQQAGSPADQVAKLRNAKEQLKDADPSALNERLIFGMRLDEFDLGSIKASTEEPAGAEPIARKMWQPSQRLTPVLTNVADDVGLDFVYQNAADPIEREFRIFEAYGGGIACLDYDQDGRVDFYFAQAAGEPGLERGVLPNCLMRNLGDVFTQVSSIADCDDRSYSFGVTAGDWNQDGFPDLVVGNLGVNLLLINQGDGTFSRQQPSGEWQTGRFTTGLAIADVTGDHLPDIVEVNYLDDPDILKPLERDPSGKPLGYPGPLHFKPAEDRVFVSDGKSGFTVHALGDVNSKGNAAANGLGLIVTDLDGQDGNEIFVANDLMPNQLWRKSMTAQKPSTQIAWTDSAASNGLAVGASGNALACMGVASGDFDRNGYPDLYVTNFEDQWSNLYMQASSSVFKDLVVAFGLDASSYKMLGFGTQAFDYDNNGTLDLIVGNGHVEDFSSKGSQFEMPTQLFSNTGDSFEQVAVEGDDRYWRERHLSRAVAKCDWNSDGRVDIVIGDLNGQVVLLQNNTAPEHNWVQFELVGTHCERDAIGTQIEIHSNGELIREICQTGDGYMTKNQPILTLGLAGNGQIDALVVRWPGGQTDRFTNVPVNCRTKIVQNVGEFRQKQEHLGETAKSSPKRGKLRE